MKTNARARSLLRLAAAAALGLGAAAAGCGGGDKLEGSISNSFSIDFDRVNIAWQTDQYLIVEWVRGPEGAEEEVAELTVDTLAPGCEIVDDREMDFLLCAILDRTTLDSTEFDSVQMGMVVLYQWGAIGDRIDGKFSVLFDNGYTLSGEFSGPLVERNG